MKTNVAKKTTTSTKSGPGLHRMGSKQEAGETVLVIFAELTQAMQANHWGRAHRLLVVAESIMTGREPSETDLCRNRPDEDADVNAARAAKAVQQ